MPPLFSSLPLQTSHPLFDNHHSMAEFTGIGDGDLQSVVRGFTNDFSTTDSIMDCYPQKCFSPLIIQQEDDSVFTASFPDLFETTTVFDELEDLYKPFYPMFNPLSPQTVLSSSISVSGEEREQEKEAFCGSPVVASAATAATSALGVKYKRRKNQHKRVVKEVSAEGVSSDVWAWRKYGQKPIKGSPYPRSYYRCSSLKGCLARKQVERSLSDPQMFVITYTAEHCHSQPTRKSSLAGTTRHKFSPPKTASATTTSADSGSSLSPPTPLLAAKEDEILDQLAINEKRTEEKEEKRQMCDMVLSDDFLWGFDDELDRLIF